MKMVSEAENLVLLRMGLAFLDLSDVYTDADIIQYTIYHLRERWAHESSIWAHLCILLLNWTYL